MDTSADVLDVWVNRPLMTVETLQMLADAEFTPKTGIPVKVTIMPNEEKIILANAAQQTPDIAMGLTLGRRMSSACGMLSWTCMSLRTSSIITMKTTTFAC